MPNAYVPTNGDLHHPLTKMVSRMSVVSLNCLLRHRHLSKVGRGREGGVRMAGTDALARVLAFTQLRNDDAAWSLLRADSAPIIAGVLAAHLAAETRRMPVADLTELVDEDLDVLRAHGEALPRSAQGYCADWRAAGYLIRRPDDDARGETFELSAGALRAIRLLESLAQPRSSVTESRLTSIAEQISKLATDTDGDTERRLAQLTEQRAAIDDEISRVSRGGDVVVIDADRAVERARDILNQVAELPSDFARVRSRFEELNRLLYERLIDSDDIQRGVLLEVFRGVDLISDSDEGRSFGHFLRLLLDPDRGAEFDRDVDSVLEREFSGALTALERRTLRRMFATLKTEGAEIHGVISNFARGLRRYVQSQQHQRDRVLRSLVRRALAAGVHAAPHTKPFRDTDIVLPLSTVPLSSVGGVRPHNPSDLDATAPIEAQPVGTVDWEQLRLITRDTEIDFPELTKNVDTVRESTNCPTIADVLERFPATQGVASIVGLLAIAHENGIRDDAHEIVLWTGADDIERTAPIPQFRFIRSTT